MFRAVPGCSAVFRGVPGCSRVFRAVPRCSRVFRVFLVLVHAACCFTPTNYALINVKPQGGGGGGGGGADPGEFDILM